MMPNSTIFFRSFQKGLGTKVRNRMIFYQQMDSEDERTVKTLKDMLRYYVFEFKGSWDEHLLLIEFDLQ